jgi:hypothetical protein
LTLNRVRGKLRPWKNKIQQPHEARNAPLNRLLNPLLKLGNPRLPRPPLPNTNTAFLNLNPNPLKAPLPPALRAQPAIARAAKAAATDVTRIAVAGAAEAEDAVHHRVGAATQAQAVAVPVTIVPRGKVIRRRKKAVIAMNRANALMIFANPRSAKMVHVTKTKMFLHRLTKRRKAKALPKPPPTKRTKRMNFTKSAPTPIANLR